MSTSPEVSLEFPADTYYLATIRAVVSAFARRAGFGPEVSDEITLAVDEVCSAATDRQPEPGQRIRVELGRDARKIWIQVTDEGSEWPIVFDSDLGMDARASESDPLGYVIVSAYMDELEFLQTDAGSQVRLVRALPRVSGRLRRV